MSAPVLLEGSSVPMSWDEFLALDDSIHGEFFGSCLMVPPAPDKQHQGAVFELTVLLKKAVPASLEVVSGWGWRPHNADGDNQSWTPDVTVAPRTDDNVQLESVTPELLVEVTSTNYSTDMVTKRLAYAAAGVPNYWVLDRRQDVLRVFALRGGAYVETQTVRRDQPEAVTVAGVPVTVDITKLMS